jgi:hypothetical protein
MLWISGKHSKKCSVDCYMAIDLCVTFVCVCVCVCVHFRMDPMSDLQMKSWCMGL